MYVKTGFVTATRRALWKLIIIKTSAPQQSSKSPISAIQ